MTEMTEPSQGRLSGVLDRLSVRARNHREAGWEHSTVMTPGEPADLGDFEAVELSRGLTEVFEAGLLRAIFDGPPDRPKAEDATP